MAIQTDKLLPSSKSRGSIIKKNISVPSILKKNTGDIEKSDNGSSLLVIKNKVVQIDKLLKNDLVLKKESIKKKNKESEREDFQKKEKELETKTPEKEIKKPSLTIPGLGVFDVIKRFLFFTALGRLFELTKQFAPQIADFVKNITPVIDFFENFLGNIFNGIVDFIDWGYKAYDNVRSFTKKIGGEPFQKTFDEFSKNLNTFINLAIIAGLASTGGTNFGLGKKGGKPGAAPSTKPNIPYKYDRFGAQVQRNYGHEGRKIYQNSRANGRSQQQALNDVRRAVNKGRISGAPQTGSLGGTNSGSKIFGRGFKNAGSRITTKLLGKTGVKIVGKVFGRIPIIGGLVDFLFALWSGEKPGRAAAKAVGATIGSALGTFIPIPIAGTILGGILGDIVGGALYDTLIGNQPPKKKMATGGKVSTRGGNVSFNRPTRKIKLRRSIKKVKPQTSRPGQDVGGENKIKKLFPDPMRPIDTAAKPNPNVVNPLGTLKDVSKNLKEIPFLGGVMGASVDIAMGQRPDKSFLNGFGTAIGDLVQSAIDNKVGQSIDELVKSTLAMAEGGEVVSRSIGSKDTMGQEVGERIAKLLNSSLNDRINTIFNSIIKQFEKQTEGSNPSRRDNPTPEGPDDYDSGKTGSFESGEYIGDPGDNDGEQTGLDMNLRGGIGTPIYAPRDLIYKRKGSDGNPSVGLQGTPEVLGPSGSGFGFYGSYFFKDGNKEYEVLMGHFRDMPFRGSSEGEIIPKGTLLGYQGASGRTIGSNGGPYPHISLHLNGIGFRASNRELVEFANSLVKSGGTKATDSPKKQGKSLASWYGPGFYGNQTADGEVLKRDSLWVAHKTLPFGTKVKFTYGNNSIILPVKDRGPFHGNREWDLTEKAAEQLGTKSAGEVNLKYEIINKKGGGLIPSKQPKRDMSSLKSKASYEHTGRTVYIQTLIVEKPVPMPVSSGVAGLSIPPSA